MRTNTHRILSICCTSFAAVALSVTAGCHDDASDHADRSAQHASDKLEHASDRVADKASDAGDNVKDATHHAADNVRDATR